MNSLDGWMLKRPHVSTVIFVFIIVVLSIMSIGFMSVVPVLFAAIITLYVQPKMSHHISKLVQIKYAMWAIVTAAFIASTVLNFYQPVYENSLTWWTFIFSIILSTATISTLTWTVYTTQNDRSEKNAREKLNQPIRVTSIIHKKDTGEFAVTVWNSSDLPISDIWVGVSEYDEAKSYPNYIKIPHIPAGEKRIADIEHSLAKECILRFKMLNKAPAIVFKDAFGNYWLRDLYDQLHEYDSYNRLSEEIKEGAFTYSIGFRKDYTGL